MSGRGHHRRQNVRGAHASREADIAASARMQTAQASRSRIPPPLPFLLGLVLGWSCSVWQPWQIASDPRGRHILVAVGVFAALGSLTLIICASRALRRHGTSADPRVESTAIVASGPFAFSRNPIYVALACLHAAIACFFDNAWMLLALAPALVIVDRFVVIGEERYLVARFGRDYLDYASRVRRWL